MSEIESLFNKFMMAKGQVQLLAAIVQNPGMTITDKDMCAWRTSFQCYMVEMQKLEGAVLKHYGKT